MKNILSDSNGTFSWRKAITATITLLLALCVIGYEVWNWKELPSGYQMLIGSVIGFYFFRRTIDRIKGKTQTD